jgi:hypothetical protein
MPSVQQGQVVKTRGGSWSYRYYDEDGKRRQKGGHQTKTAAPRRSAKNSTRCARGRRPGRT